MSKRKIAGCVNVRIRAGDYQHIEVVKYAEEEIEYSSVAELKSKEDDLNSDLVDCMLRSLKATSDKLGKGKAEAIEIEQTLSKAIPEWLANDPVPNIANGAKKVLNTVADKQKVEKDKAIETEKSVLLEERQLSDHNQAKQDHNQANQAKQDSNKAKFDNVKQDRFSQYVKDANIIIDAKDTENLFEADSSSKNVITTESKDIVDIKDEDGFDIFSESGDLFDNK